MVEESKREQCCHPAFTAMLFALSKCVLWDRIAIKQNTFFQAFKIVSIVTKD